MGNRTLVRQDGSTFTVPEAEAEKLLTLGYREQSPVAEMEEGISRGIENYYTTPGQQAITGIEGGLSGLSVGLSDLLLDSEESRERARYNPGVRMGSEVVGALLPLTPGGIGRALAYTPAGALMKGAGLAADALAPGSKVVNAMARAGIEGAGFGAGAAITTAQMNGDPLTAESILAGLGWGALFGGGLGALGGAVEARMEARTARALEKEEAMFSSVGRKEAAAAERVAADSKVHSILDEGMKGEHANLKLMEDTIYSRIANSMDDAVKVLKGATQVAEELPKNLDFKALNRSQTQIYSQLADSYNIGIVRGEARGFVKEFSAAQLAAKEGKYEKMIGHLEKFKENMALMETKLGGAPLFSAEKVIGQANDLIGLAKFRLDNAVSAAETLAETNAIHSTLSGFPKTVDEFIGMTPQRVEKLTAAIDSLGKVKAAELAGVKEAVADAVAHMSEGLGVKLEGTPGMQMQGMWKALKQARSSRVQDEMRMAREGNLLWKRGEKTQEKAEMAKFRGEQKKQEWKSKTAAQRAMESAARYGAGSWAAQRLGTPGYILGSTLVSGLIGMKGAILGTIADKAGKWVPKAARGLQKYGSRVEPLATRLDGYEDQEHRDRMSLMKARMKEVSDAAPSVRDTLYRSVQPLGIEHPELAATIHKQAVARFQFLLSKMPKDPGLAFSNLQSIWKPDAVATEKFARYWEVFHNPVGVMTKALNTGKITMEAAEGLKNMNPELFSTLRVHLLERISDPSVRKLMKYDDQVHLGLMLDIPVHSTMDPRFISAQQQMFTERNQPLEMNPRIQPGGGAGRPSGPGPSATAGQRITEH